MRSMIRTLYLFLLLAAAANAALRGDIEYGKAGDVSLKMDASIPDGTGPFPTVILVHGGGWRNGDKQTNFKPLFDPLTKAGFAWFTVNYRLAPAHPYPAAVDDVLQSIRYIQAHAEEYKVDKKRVALTGESAGGHIVALIGARDGHKLQLAAVIPFYPPTDLEAMVAGRDKTGGAVTALGAFIGFTEPDAVALKRLREASPVTYVQKGMPPFLIVHGTKDPVVNFLQGRDMCDKIRQAGSSCEMFPVDGAPHGVNGWEKTPSFLGYKQKVVDWLHQTMK